MNFFHFYFHIYLKKLLIDLAIYIIWSKNSDIQKDLTATQLMNDSFKNYPDQHKSAINYNNECKYY